MSSGIKERRTSDGTRYHVTADRPTGPEPVPAPPPPPPPAVEPEPIAEPVPYPAYRSGLPIPAEASPAAIAALAGARGSVALEEVLGAIVAVDAELVVHRPRLASAEVRGAIAVVSDLLGRREVYARRAAALADALGVERPTVPPAPTVPALAKLWASLPAGADLGTELAGRRRAAAVALDAADRELAAAVGIAGNARHYGSIAAPPAAVTGYLGTGRVPTVGAWPPDERLARLDRATARRAECAAAVDQLDADRAELVKLVAAHASRAVEAAGGAEAVQRSLVAALALSEVTPAEPAELGTIDADIARLVAAGVDGPELDARKARRAELVGAAAADRQQRNHRRRSIAESIVSRALAAEASAVAELARLAPALDLVDVERRAVLAELAAVA